MRLLRAAGRVLAWAVVGLVAGFAAGVVLAIAGRAVMRSVAVVAGLEPTWNGHYNLYLLFMLGSQNSLVGLLYVAVRRFVPGTGARKGAIYGAVGLAILIYPAILREAHLVVAELGWGPTILGVGLISSLFVWNGVLIEAGVARLSRRLGRTAPTAPEVEPASARLPTPTAAGAGP